MLTLGEDEPLCRMTLRVGKNIDNTSLFGYLTVVENRDIIADLLDNAHLVGNDDDGDAELFIDLTNQAEDSV